MSERTFWKTLAWILGALLASMVLVNALDIYAVSWQMRSFTASCLFCIGVGHTVVSPRSSMKMLDEVDERRYRRRTLIVGMVVSVLLGLFLLIPEVREESMPWVLVPVIALGPVLVVREYFIRVQKEKR